MGDSTGWTRRGIFWAQVSTLVTLLGILAGIGLYFVSRETEPVPTPPVSLSTFDEPPLELRPERRIEGLPIHNRVTTGFLADEGWSFLGESGDFVALTAVKGGESVAQSFKLAIVPEAERSAAAEDQPAEYCPNLLHDIPGVRLALFRLPRSGRFRLESSLNASDREEVILKAYSLRNSLKRRIETSRVVIGTMEYPSEVDLYGLHFSGRERLHVRIEPDGAEARIGFAQILPDGRISGWSSTERLLMLEPTPVEGSVLALFTDRVSSPFQYTLTVRQFAAPRQLEAGGESVLGSLDFPEESKQYSMPVKAGSTWRITLDCTPPFRGKMAIARPARGELAETISDVCAPLFSSSVVAEVDGTMTFRVFSADGSQGQYHLSVWPTER